MDSFLKGFIVAGLLWAIIFGIGILIAYNVEYPYDVLSIWAGCCLGMLVDFASWGLLVEYFEKRE